jgi:hypothetical protein
VEYNILLLYSLKVIEQVGVMSNRDCNDCIDNAVGIIQMFMKCSNPNPKSFWHLS